MSIYDTLNTQQKEAVFHTEGPVLILAGAGSGKTRVLTHRIVYLIEEKGVNPWNIMAITFTNKAAGELKARIGTVLGENASEVWASTFHSTCARMLRRDADRLGFSKNYTIYDSDDSRRLMKECLRTLGIEEKVLSHKAVQMKKSDYEKYDFLLGMDEWNIRNMNRIVKRDPEHKIHMLLDFSKNPRAIADPWYTGNFDVTYDDIQEGCQAFLEYLKREGRI